MRTQFDFFDQTNVKRLITDIREAKNNLSFICFVGAGVSIAQGYPDWKTYVDHLVNYWIYHLNDLKNQDEINISSTLSDVDFLKSLSDSNYSLKRKTDIVQYLIKKICGKSSNVSNDIYNKHVLDFEKYIFTELTPSNPVNLILDELVKLRPIFITTNYDKQIEISFEKYNNFEPKIYSKLGDINTYIHTDSILHLHGIPTNKVDDFINSSKTYVKMYYNNSVAKNNLSKVIKPNKNVVLFVGCSLEEDEVINMLQMNNTNISYYALMKYEKYSNDSDYKNEIIKSYYEDELNIKIVWYGSDFGDLPKFIEKLIDEVLQSEDAKLHLNQTRKVLLDTSIVGE